MGTGGGGGVCRGCRLGRVSASGFPPSTSQRWASACANLTDPRFPLVFTTLLVVSAPCSFSFVFVPLWCHCSVPPLTMGALCLSSAGLWRPERSPSGASSVSQRVGSFLVLIGVDLGPAPAVTASGCRSRLCRPPRPDASLWRPRPQAPPSLACSVSGDVVSTRADRVTPSDCRGSVSYPPMTAFQSTAAATARGP